jgi:hypothetical protein
MTIPTWDLFIMLFFAIAVAYGFLLGKNRIILTLLTTYIMLAVANELGDSLLSANFILKSGSSTFILKTSVFLIAIFLLAILFSTRTAIAKYVANSDEGTSMGSIIFTIIYSFLSAGLIITSIIYFMTPEGRTEFFAQSHWAKVMMDLRIWWLLLPLGVLVFENFKRGSSAE